MILYGFILAFVLIWLFRREGRYITLTGMTLALLALIYGIGHIYYYNVRDFDQTAATVTTSLCWMWVGLVAGNELCRLVFAQAAARQHALLTNWTTTPLQGGAHAEWLWRLILLLATGVLAMAFVALGTLGVLRHGLSLTTATDLADFRGTVGNQGGYLFQIFVTTIAPFLAVMSMLLAKLRPNLINVSTAIALIVLVLLFKVSTFHKAQWVWLLISLGLGWYLIRRVAMRIGTGLLAAVLIFGAFVLAASIAYPTLDTLAIVNVVVYRIFDICNEGLYQTFYVYPHYLEHTHGLNIGLVHSVYGYGEFIPAHTQVARFYGAWASTYNAMFIADSWVDFGLGGVIAVSLVIGFLLKGVDLYIAVLGKTPVAMAMTAALFFGAISLSSLSAFTSLLTGGIALLPMFVVGVDAVGARVGRWLLRERQGRPVQPA